MITLRRATLDDSDFLSEMLRLAIGWDPSADPTQIEIAMSDPKVTHYVTDWGHEGDFGIIASEDQPVGAVWWRYFEPHDPGYGFVDSAIPEVSISVMDLARGRGVGTMLLKAVLAEAETQSVPALSLSVEPANPARNLYERLGFRNIDTTDDTIADGSVTMLFRIRQPDQTDDHPNR